MTTYELEHVKMWFDGPAKDGYLDRTEEETIRKSSDLEELKRIAKNIKRVGNRNYREECRIVELDSRGDIVNYVWFYPFNR